MMKIVDVRSKAASALGSAFSQVPDKQQAWNDLHRLTTDEDVDVRLRPPLLLVLRFLKCQINNRHGMIYID